MLQHDALGEHDVAYLAFHALLTRIVRIEEVVQGHGELDSCPHPVARFRTGQGEVQTQAAFEHILVSMFHGSATACYDIVVYACLKAISPTKNQSSTRLEVKTTKVRVGLLKDYLLTLEIGSYVCTNG